ncbi:hypothetical protein SOVF_132520 [Spinacia oleracea]|nr:hypothetical protein SOVF_132520 [Spinacia oleracea]
MIIMVGSSGAARHEIDGQQLLSNIMLEGRVLLLLLR